MRVVHSPQMELGSESIANMKFDPRERNGITRLLIALQHIFVNPDIRSAVFHLLETMILPNVSKEVGRPGMELWAILVCGTLRLDGGQTYDQLLNNVNRHADVHQMLGHGTFNYTYTLQQLKDNVGLLTQDILDEINKEVVRAGHRLLEATEEPLVGRCDSWVCKTNVHFPTDINLLYDAIRKTNTLLAKWCKRHGLTDYRQYKHNIKVIKKLMRSAQNRKYRKDKSEGVAVRNAKAVENAKKEYESAYETYLDACKLALVKARETVDKLGALEDANTLKQKQEVTGFMAHAERQIDQTRRRALLGEVISHAEKVFSIFKPHTQWIVKGKAGVMMELGLRVCILEDQHRFILHHMVMENQTDEKVAVPMVKEAKKRHPNLKKCSFDKGFHTKPNQEELKEILDTSVLPRKGKLSKTAKAEEQTEEFKEARRAHSAVESAISALQEHGLEMCRDYGIDRFKRYVALGVVARNIHRLGDILWALARKREEKERGLAANAPDYKLAA